MKLLIIWHRNTTLSIIVILIIQLTISIILFIITLQYSDCTVLPDDFRLSFGGSKFWKHLILQVLMKTLIPKDDRRPKIQVKKQIQTFETADYLA